MSLSLSLRWRGLKSQVIQTLSLILNVAIFTMAWIEIKIGKSIEQNQKVAIFTMAWIEIPNVLGGNSEIAGRYLYDGVD